MSQMKCHHKMRKGIALQNTLRGVPDFPDGAVVTMSYGGPGKLIECNKCIKCGYSTSL